MVCFFLLLSIYNHAAAVQIGIEAVYIYEPTEAALFYLVYDKYLPLVTHLRCVLFKVQDDSGNVPSAPMRFGGRSTLKSSTYSGPLRGGYG